MIDQLNGTLLIVDDEQDIIDVLVEILKPTNLTILSAYNGEEALKLLLATPQIDAVLSDIKMPVMDGLQFLSKLRERESDIPFVFLTAFGDKENLLEALKLGAIDFIEKPFHTENIRNVIDKVIRLGQILKLIEADIAEVCKERAELDEKRKKLQSIKRSMLGGFFHYREIDSDKLK